MKIQETVLCIIIYSSIITTTYARRISNSFRSEIVLREDAVHCNVSKQIHQVSPANSLFCLKFTTTKTF